MTTSPIDAMNATLYTIDRAITKDIVKTPVSRGLSSCSVNEFHDTIDDS